MAESLDAKYLLRASVREKKAWEDAAYRGRVSLAVWMRRVLNEQAEKVSHAGVTAVREPPSSVAVPPQARLPSAPVGAARVSARGMAVRGGKCSADVAFGSRCKLCGEVHR